MRWSTGGRTKELPGHRPHPQQETLDRSPRAHRATTADPTVDVRYSVLWFERCRAGRESPTLLDLDDEVLQVGGAHARNARGLPQRMGAHAGQLLPCLKR